MVVILANSVVLTMQMVGAVPSSGAFSAATDMLFDFVFIMEVYVRIKDLTQIVTLTLIGGLCEDKRIDMGRLLDISP